MSYQAPFVDAATSVDPQNKENTFISYYSYGSVLGLALDLSLRNLDGDKNLDDFMKLMWQEFGKPEVPYTNRDIETTLGEYAGKEFASDFFNKYIYDSQMPDYVTLLASVGVNFGKANPGKAVLGTNIRIEDGVGVLRSNAIKGSPIYEAGIESTDEIISVAGTKLSSISEVEDILRDYEPGEEIEITFHRWNEEKTVRVTLAEDPSFKTDMNSGADDAQRKKRSAWLK